MCTEKIIIAFFLVLFCFAVSVSAQDEPLKRIEQRAAEIEKYLSEKPHCAGCPVTDRTAWEMLAKDPAAKKIIRDAETLAAQPIPELPEPLYKEYYQNGNRTHYQNVRGQKYRRISVFTLAECFENKGRFIAPAEEIIRSVCQDPSWLLPAHDSNGLIYDGKDNYIDLSSSDTSAELALADYWLQDKLSPEVRKLIRDNVERRTFSSYEETAKDHILGKGKKNWWISGENNWNSVCHANVICAAAALIESPQKRAWYIACAEHFMSPFFKGFTPDGYCSEGMGYWNYGFGHFVELAEIIFQATGGSVDFFQMPLVKNCASFGPRMEVAPGQFAAFADCAVTAKPNAMLVQFLSKRLQLGYENYENTPKQTGNLKATAVYCFPNSADKMPKGKSAATPLTELRTLFPDAEILICRKPETRKPESPLPALNFVCKAGHNAEQHNHNDVGSFTVMYAGTMPVLDPGGEVYTRRTFSGKRYDSKLLNSYGHPVPVVNGQHQKTGRKAEGKIIAKTFSAEKDTVVMDIAAAYGLKEVKTLTRQFDYRRSENTLAVTDNVELDSPGTFETALETYEPFSRKATPLGIELLIGVQGKQIRVVVQAAGNGEPLPLEFSAAEIDEDATARKKPHRLGFKIKGEVQNASVITTITAVL